jgi:hypothetical protein
VPAVAANGSVAHHQIWNEAPTTRQNPPHHYSLQVAQDMLRLNIAEPFPKALSREDLIFDESQMKCRQRQHASGLTWSDYALSYLFHMVLNDDFASRREYLPG